MHDAYAVVATMFRWPDGIVLGNLIASAFWALPAFIHLHLKINRNQRELTGQPDAGTL